MGNESPSIAFIGVTSDRTSSATYLHQADAITPEVDGDNVNIIDEWLTANNGGGIIYDLYGVHYSEYRDIYGNAFSDPVGVASHINEITAGIVTAMYIRRSLPLGDSHTVNTTVGTPFTYNAVYTGGVSYYWDEASFPNGVDVSRFDRRKISGIITQTGTYTINFDVVNRIGTRSTSVDIVVS